MLTVLSGFYLLVIVGGAVTALAGWTAHLARARFRSPVRWAALSVACSVAGAAFGGSVFAAALFDDKALMIGVALLPLVGTVLGAAVPLLLLTKLRRMEMPAARGTSWPVFVVRGLSMGDRVAMLTISAGLMQFNGSDQKQVVPLDQIEKVTIDVATVVIEQTSPGPAIHICPAVGDDAGPDAVRMAAIRLHKRLAAEIARGVFTASGR